MTEEKSIRVEKYLENLNENYDKTISQQNLKKEINEDEFDLEKFEETEKEEYIFKNIEKIKFIKTFLI